MADLIAALHPAVRDLFRFIEDEADRIAFQHGKRARFTQGMRTKAQQDALYAKGRTAAGAIVTHVRGGYSLHNYGCAVDIGVFTEDFKAYRGSDPLYEIIGQAIVKLNIPGLVWGGNFPKMFGGTFRDMPHFQFSDPYGPSVTSAMLKYATAPHTMPLSTPILPSDPAMATPQPNPEFAASFKAMQAFKVFSAHTQPTDIITAEKLGVFLTRYFEQLKTQFEPKR